MMAEPEPQREAPEGEPVGRPAEGRPAGTRRRRGRHSAAVFVRVRPLLSHLGEATATPLPGLCTHAAGRGAADGDGDGDGSVGVVALAAEGNATGVGGFTGILGAEEGNAHVFERAFRPCLPTVVAGGTAALFCYGYTGAGKTHTVFGVEEDLGMYRRASEELLAQIEAFNAGDGAGSATMNSTGPLMLHATVVEVHNEEVFDLMAGRKPATLRMNSKGQLLVRGATLKTRLDAKAAKAKGAEFEVRTEGLRSVPVTCVEDLDAIHQMSKRHRAVGSSTTHDQSSRSHAVFKLEVVNQQLLDAFEVLEESEAIKPGIQSKYAKTKKLADKKALIAVEETITHVNAEIEAMHEAHPSLGGRMILVDLAGADSDDRGADKASAAELKESRMINKSLLALKECLRGLHAQHAGGTKQKMPFRDSAITRLLEEVLVPKRGRDSDTVMLVNCAMLAQLEKKTVNSLRYGQLYATGSVGASRRKPAAAKLGGNSIPAGPAEPRPRSAAGVRGGAAAASKSKAKVAAKVAADDQADAAVLAQLIEIYAEHVPDKTPTEVGEILAKFAGREHELLRKVKAKYCK
jgi:hypothetical protein